MSDEPLPPPLSSGEAIDRALVRRVNECGLSPGMAIGVLDGDDQKFFTRGRTGLSGEPVDEQTIFEIGSITKLFTALLLTDMAQRGEVSLNTAVADLLPMETRVPDRGGVPITLAHLAMHTSGLPRLPDDIVVGSADPYAGYTPERLYGFLSRHQLRRTPGEGYEYSNLGAGLLGHALGLRAGCGYEQLLRTRILDPLAMSNTGIDWQPGTTARRAAGHDDSADPVADWTFGALAGVGAMQSTAQDLIRFLAALTAEDGPFGPALGTMLEPGTAGGLGFGLPQDSGLLAMQHEGGTGGFRSYMGCVPRWRRGAVVLANASSGAVTDLGIHCCDQRWGLRWYRQAIAVEPAHFDRLVGTYRMQPALLFDVTRSGTRLMVQLTGQRALQVFPSAEWHFFYKAVGAQITFEPGPDGRAARLILHQNSLDQIAERLS